MKKKGIINAQLSYCIAALGHMDTFMIGDAGMPIPQGVEIVDLALCNGLPSFKDVMEAVLEETVVEYAYLAKEIKENNTDLYKYISDKFNNIDIGYDMISHNDLKKKSKDIKFAIRTGEFSPYPNVIFRAGVAF